MECVWAVLIGFLAWLWLLYLRFVRFARVRDESKSFLEQYKEWKEALEDAGDTWARILLVLGGLWFTIVDLTKTWIRRGINVALITSGPAGLTAVGSACADWDAVPKIIRELRLFFCDIMDVIFDDPCGCSSNAHHYRLFDRVASMNPIPSIHVFPPS